MKAAGGDETAGGKVDICVIPMIYLRKELFHIFGVAIIKYLESRRQTIV